ncbi:MAG: DMT family transporter [Chloroflexia bacterium]
MSNPRSATRHRASPRLIGAGFVLVAATLWGTLGTLYKFGTEQYGLTPVAIVFWRAALAAIILWVALGVVMPLVGGGWGGVRVRGRDLPLFATFGLLGVTAFYILYIYAVVLVGVAVGVVLLYTAPVFVALMSWRFLGESFTARKSIALLLTVAGCVLVARAYDPGLLRVNAVGILCGLGSGFTYALYSILGKFSLKRGYGIATMSLYVYSIGAVGLLAVALFVGDGGSTSQDGVLAVGGEVGAWALLVALALFATIGALYVYTASLRHLEAGVASILATFEPVVATALAYFVVGERIEWPQAVGGLLILAGVLALQIQPRSKLQARIQNLGS